MKILSFGGGLGNQIFCYAFYLYMKEKYPNHRIYGLYNKKKLSEHYGLEIDKWFDVQLPPQRWYATAICGLLYLWKKMVKNTRYVDTVMEYCKNENAIAFLAFKFSNRYFPKGEWIKFKIDETRVTEDNQIMLSLIRSSNSIFVHVRRGDFFSARYIHLFDGTCPIEYYKQAIEDVEKKVESPKFFVFSDDMEWARTNLPLPENANYIDWNIGTDSPIDMFLMSNCKYAIIANSSFSYWGAYLGNRKKIVYYPKKWNKGIPSPQIFPHDWLSF